MNNNPEGYIKTVAKTGYITKGLIYCLVGIIAFMAAFNMNGQSTSNTDKKDVLQKIEQQTGGQILLALVALGLVCYAVWRIIQAFMDTEDKGKNTKGILLRARYVLSGLTYGSIALVAGKMLFSSTSGSSDSNKQPMVQKLLAQPFGQWLVGIVALIITGIGVYQIYYGLSEKFKKHVEKSVSEMGRKVVLITGKLGYMARGVVWLVIGILFARAAIYSSSSQAGDTSNAFSFLSDVSYGKYLVALVGLGLILYGTFNFVRARYERFSL